MAEQPVRSFASQGREEVSDRFIRRNLRVILGTIALVSVLPMVRYATVARIEYDGWMHLLIARDDSWGEMARLIVINTHPPLYFLLLRAVSFLGTEPLVYRSISILAAGVGVVAIGTALARVASTGAAPILCALAFGLATSTAVIASEVRSYMVATAFLLLALSSYLDLVRPGGDRRSRVLFTVFAGLSFLTHYGALLVLLALFAAPLLVAVGSPGYRRAWRQALPSRWRSDALTLLPLVVLIATAYLGHITRHATTLSHLPEYYYSGGESLWSWTMRSLGRQVDLFSPVALSAEPWLRVLGIGLVLTVPLLLIVVSRKGRDQAAAAVVPATLLALTVLHLVGSMVGRYPFGGALRHQFFFFPFVLATLFLFVDRVLARLADAPRRWAAAIAALVVVGVAAWQWDRLPRPTEELFGVEFALFRSEIPAAEAVYVDGFSLFTFFGHLQHWEWSSREIPGVDRFRVLRATNGEEELLVLADRAQWNALPEQEPLYRELHDALETLSASSLAIFHLDQEAGSTAADGDGLAEETDAILAAARAGGLEPRNVVRVGSNLFAFLAVGGSTDWTASAPPEIVLARDGLIRAQPNPIRVCGDEGVGTATISWSFPGRAIDIRLEAPDGTLWASKAGSGSAETGNWVSDGLTFYVQDRNAEDPTDEDGTLAVLVVEHTDRGCRAAAATERAE